MGPVGSVKRKGWYERQPAGFCPAVASALAAGDAQLHILLFGNLIVPLGVVIQVFGDPEFFPVAPNQLLHRVANLIGFLHAITRVSITRAISIAQYFSSDIGQITKCFRGGCGPFWANWDTNLRNTLPNDACRDYPSRQITGIDVKKNRVYGSVWVCLSGTPLPREKRGIRTGCMRLLHAVQGLVNGRNPSF